MSLFVRLTLALAALLIAFVVLAFVVKILIVAAVLAALAVAGVVVVAAVRRTLRQARGDRRPGTRVMTLTARR